MVVFDINGGVFLRSSQKELLEKRIKNDSLELEGYDYAMEIGSDLYENSPNPPNSLEVCTIKTVVRDLLSDPDEAVTILKLESTLSYENLLELKGAIDSVLRHFEKSRELKLYED